MSASSKYKVQDSGQSVITNGTDGKSTKAKSSKTPDENASAMEVKTLSTGKSRRQVQHAAVVPINNMMSGPVNTIITSEDKEQHWALEDIASKLDDLRIYERYELTKIVLFLIAFLCACMCVSLVFYALALTPLFASRPPTPSQRTGVLVLCGLLTIPTFVWFKWLCCANKEVQAERAIMFAKKQERQEEKFKLQREAHVKAAKEYEELLAKRKEIMDQNENMVEEA